MKTIGPWRVTSVREAYRNPWIAVEHHEVVHPHGEDGIYGVVRFANLAVGVLPIFDDGTVPLVGQHRFPFDAYSWELPEGGGPKGEPPEETARRELREETGLTAAHLVPLGQCDLSNSVTDERAVYFLAYGLTEGEASPDPDEVLMQQRIPLADLVKRVLSGDITDSLTHLMVGAAIMKAQAGLLPMPPARHILAAVSALKTTAEEE